MKDLGERVDEACERAINAIAAWTIMQGAAISNDDREALRAKATIALRQAIFETVRR